ncbi:MAG TPA: chitobiase/beta-hexosaminidase C-terminal domain-containing protein, partial [Opitutaceae bacterium]|nr:chitobiase/beta-hexosaminidase C-terminal domain-containing protein [Opitutaceae bacterium]
MNTDTLPVRLNLKKLQSLAILAMGFWIFGNETEALADVTLEAHNLAVTSSPSGLTSVQASSSATDGSWVQLASTATGQYMEFTTTSIPAGTYSVEMRYKSNGNRGQMSLTVDGTAVGGTLDQYAATSTWPTTTFGNVTFGTSGTHLLRMTVTGRNSSSSNYYLSADIFIFVVQNAPPPPAAPTFNPTAGTYSSAQSVTISDTTSGASIYYTTNGSTPTTSSTLYTAPVAISVTTTLKAIANNSGGSSSVTSGVYTISTGGGTVSMEAENLSVT